MDWLKDNYAELLQNPFVRSALIIVGSIVMAKLTDWIFVGIFKRWSSKPTPILMTTSLIFCISLFFIQFYFLGFQLALTFLVFLNISTLLF